jgi:hypothetical protein
VRFERRLDVFAQPRLDGAVAELLREHKPQWNDAGIANLTNFAGTCPLVRLRRPPEQPVSIVRSLRCKVQSDVEAELRAAGVRIVEDRIVVKDDVLSVAGGRQREKSLAGTRPPALEHLVMMTPVEEIVEPQSEARSGESVEPDLCVLAVHAVGTARPLARQVLDDARVRPRERALVVPDEVEWSVPFVVT